MHDLDASFFSEAYRPTLIVFLVILQDIDACFFLLRERFAVYSRTYGKDFTVGDCRITSLFQRQYPAFCENPGKYNFGIDFMDYFWGFP